MAKRATQAKLQAFRHYVCIYLAFTVTLLPSIIKPKINSPSSSVTSSCQTPARHFSSWKFTTVL